MLFRSPSHNTFRVPDPAVHETEVVAGFGNDPSVRTPALLYSDAEKNVKYCRHSLSRKGTSPAQVAIAPRRLAVASESMSSWCISKSPKQQYFRRRPARVLAVSFSQRTLKTLGFPLRSLVFNLYRPARRNREGPLSGVLIERVPQTSFSPRFV